MRSTTFFRRNPALFRVAMRLRRKNIIFMGDLLRLPASNLPASLKRRKILENLQIELAGVGLSLDARFPWWKRPVEY
jgi:hypothetical protein